MTWTYDASPYPQPWPYVIGETPPQSCIDTVRFLIGDTDTTDQQIQDGEIQGLLAQSQGDPYQSSIEACRALAAKYARQADKSVGDLHILSSQKSRAYEAMVLQIQQQALRFGTPTPYSGGMTVSDKQIDQENCDIIAPAFSVGMMDDTGTAPTYGDDDWEWDRSDHGY